MTEEQQLIAYSRANPREYAEKAAQATRENKIMKVINGSLVLIMTEKTLDEVKLDKIYEINAIYEQKSETIKIDTPESEVLTWDIQKNEVEGYMKDNSFPTPFIDNLALSRQINKSELVHKIITKVVAFNTYMAKITGQRQFYEDKIKAAVNKSEVESIVWE